MSTGHAFRLLLLAIIVVILIVSSAASARWDITLFTEAGYNSNPAMLTAEERAAFEGGDPDYLRLDSDDDALYRLGFEADYTWRPGELRMEAGVYYRYTGYAYNAEKSYHFLKPRLEVSGGKWRAEAAYAFMPEYATRIYADADETGSADFWASYEMRRGELELRYNLTGNHWLCSAGELEYNRYNDHFPEYDGLSYKFGPVWRWFGPVYIKLGYAFRVYDARGYDEEGETPESSEETDISYQEDRIELYLSRDFRAAGKKLYAGLSGDFSARYYASEKSFQIDYIHSGRRDLRLDLEPFLLILMSDRLNLRLGYGITLRDADSPYYDLSPIKDYHRSMLWARMEYEIR